MAKRDGFDVAWIAVVIVGVIAAGLVGVSGIDGELDDNEQVVLVAALGGISTMAGAALGYQVGSRSSARRSTDPDTASHPLPVGDPSNTPTNPVRIRP